MGTFYQENLKIVVGKLEATAGTTAGGGTGSMLESADFDVRLRDVELSPTIEFDDEGVKNATGDHTETESTSGIQSATVSFSTPYLNTGTATTAPKWSKFLKCCGVSEDLVTGSVSTWTPEKSEDDQTCTIEVIDIQMGDTPAATRYQLLGCAGNAVLTCEGIGKPIMWNFTFTGAVGTRAAVLNADIPELTSPDTAVASRFLSNTSTIGGVTQYLNAWSLDFGNTVEPVYDQLKANGILHYHVATRAPRFSCDPLELAFATYDPHGISVAETVGALSLAQPNSDMTLTAPRMQLLSPAVATGEGKGSWDLTYKLLRNTAGANAVEKEQTWKLVHG